MSGSDQDRVKLDLNNPVFQNNLFKLQKNEQVVILGTLRKISQMRWEQVYADKGLKWEAIMSRTGPHGSRLYTLRSGKSFRAVAFREQAWMRILSLHPDHNSAYN
ncbi:MAG: hypothetical protein U5L00_06045 [Desulfovermiculus sp.]|nr:hypothetical protein [Desulfovermiculus sp.]